MKSHFRFTKKQRNGIFLLIILIVVIQLFLFFANGQNTVPEFEDELLNKWRLELDSLAAQESESPENKLYPFNPNFISDYKGYVLDMTVEQIDALHAYRANGQWINSKEDFKRVTGVSQEWLDSISPYFKFPEWLNKSKAEVKTSTVLTERSKSFDEKIDLNEASASQLQKVYGI
ncbi:MAG: helix-hairpin-helix domain-containing protein, partial [Bacteroidota bacterium]